MMRVVVITSTNGTNLNGNNTMMRIGNDSERGSTSSFKGNRSNISNHGSL